MAKPKIPRSILIPAILLVYLAVMSYIGCPDYAAGRTSALYYFGVIGITLAVIIALHFFIKHRDRLRREREEDIEKASRNSSTKEK